MASTQDDVFSIWNLNTKTLIASKRGYSSFTVFDDEKRLCLIGKEKVLILENPLTSKQLQIFGESDISSDYISYIYSILKNRTTESDPSFHNYLISPFFINSLHIL